MALKIKKNKKQAVKKNTKEVESKIDDLICSSSLSEIAQMEIKEMIKRISYHSQKHGLVPIIENINLRFTKHE